MPVLVVDSLPYFVGKVLIGEIEEDIFWLPSDLSYPDLFAVRSVMRSFSVLNTWNFPHLPALAYPPVSDDILANRISAQEPSLGMPIRSNEADVLVFMCVFSMLFYIDVYIELSLCLSMFSSRDSYDGRQVLCPCYSLLLWVLVDFRDDGADFWQRKTFSVLLFIFTIYAQHTHIKTFFL